MTAPLAVSHRPEAGRFEVALEDGEVAHLAYRLDGGAMLVHHTEVPPRFEGRGVASALVQAAVDHARANGVSIVPLCSYVRVWMRRHPEHGDLLAR